MSSENAEKILRSIEISSLTDRRLEIIDEALNEHADDQVEACVTALQKELELYTPKDRMRHIVDICRDARLAKRGE